MHCWIKQYLLILWPRTLSIFLVCPGESADVIISVFWPLGNSIGIRRDSGGQFHPWKVVSADRQQFLVNFIQQTGMNKGMRYDHANRKSDQLVGPSWCLE
ncbi:hypothetical protein EDB19DRAFT_134249 [Suillus lakei]|nr:hypothetical protein EDB19DRAFT_134249 [Suillus lakei]